MLQVTDAIRQLIVDRAPANALREQATREGMRPLRQEALRLVSEDITTISEILRSVYPL